MIREQKKKPEKRLQKRIKLIAPLLLLVYAGMLFKLFDLQILQHQALTEKSERQYTRTFYSQPKRGIIYDRNWREIAADIEVESIYANPSEVDDKKKTARTISDVLGLDYGSVAKKMQAGKNFIWIKRHVNPKTSSIIKNYNMAGIDTVKEYKRYYPKREIASRLVGFAGTDNYGLSGIEHSYNDYLRGGGRWLIVEKDAKGRRMRPLEKKSNRFKQCDIILTIDEVIQHIAEKELREKVTSTRAKEGLAVVMDPKTGEILAMADYPPFNPNRFRRYSSENWKNKVVSNAYEPGSTFKTFLAASAVEMGIDPNSMFYCENGELLVGDVAIHEAAAKKYEWLSMVDIITKSSNIGAIKIGEKIGKQPYYEFIKKFGFGSETGIDLGGESSGLVRDTKDWSSLSLCSVSIGQEISATPLQVINALSAIANGGFLMKPRVVKGIYKNGQPLQVFQPEIIRRVISKKTSMILTAMLRKVVEEGTGKQAALQGYSVVGKTGTAQKFDSEINAYSKTKYLASFAGYFPAEDPQLAILVMVDEPRTTFWGGTVAAPVFRAIAKQAARYLNIPSRSGKVIWVNQTDPQFKEKVSEYYFNDEEKSQEDNSALSNNIYQAFKRIKKSPRHYNDMQIQKAL